ncbi:toprim domain-containing protein, partial [Acholeplasma laidlawii]
MKQKIYVVEGTHDETLLKQIDPNIRTVSVGGSQIKEDVIQFLKTYEDKFQIILLLDPDYTGEQIRKRI